MALNAGFAPLTLAKLASRSLLRSQQIDVPITVAAPANEQNDDPVPVWPQNRSALPLSCGPSAPNRLVLLVGAFHPPLPERGRVGLPELRSSCGANVTRRPRSWRRLAVPRAPSLHRTDGDVSC